MGNVSAFHHGQCGGHADSVIGAQGRTIRPSASLHLYDLMGSASEVMNRSLVLLADPYRGGPVRGSIGRSLRPSAARACDQRDCRRGPVLIPDPALRPRSGRTPARPASFVEARGMAANCQSASITVQVPVRECSIMACSVLSGFRY